MLYICHRINTSEELKNIPECYGVELDLRDNIDGSIYIEHNPFTKGEDFEQYLRNYKHDLMIMNIKSERIEEKALELISRYNVREYFFLDSSFPMIYLMSHSGNHNFAVRFSEFEGLDTVRSLIGKVDWVWVDCFTKMPLTKGNYSELKKSGYKLCIVSPELQGQPERIDEYGKYLKENDLVPDAICTKHYNIERWKKYFI